MSVPSRASCKKKKEEKDSNVVSFDAKERKGKEALLFLNVCSLMMFFFTLVVFAVSSCASTDIHATLISFLLLKLRMIEGGKSGR